MPLPIRDGDSYGFPTIQLLFPGKRPLVPAQTGHGNPGERRTVPEMRGHALPHRLPVQDPDSGRDTENSRTGGEQKATAFRPKLIEHIGRGVFCANSSNLIFKKIPPVQLQKFKFHLNFFVPISVIRAK